MFYTSFKYLSLHLSFGSSRVVQWISHSTDKVGSSSPGFDPRHNLLLHFSTQSSYMASRTGYRISSNTAAQIQVYHCTKEMDSQSHLPHKNRPRSINFFQLHSEPSPGQHRPSRLDLQYSTRNSSPIGP